MCKARLGTAPQPFPASTGLFISELLQQISYKFWFVLKNTSKNSPLALLFDRLNRVKQRVEEYKDKVVSSLL